jgi:hypothetical protein
MILAAGCADGLGAASPHGASPSQPVMNFPAASELEKLPSLPPPRDAFAPDAIAVDDWRFAAPAASADDPAAYDDASPWGDFARKLASGRARLSPGLRCAAAELARFEVERGGRPTESLRRFTVARCGGHATHVAPIAYTGTAPETMGDEIILQHARTSLEQAITTHFTTEGHHALGVATARA